MAWTHIAAALRASDSPSDRRTAAAIEGWLSEATAALQLKGLWSRTCAGIEAFLLHAALASNLLNWWERRELLHPARQKAEKIDCGRGPRWFGFGARQTEPNGSTDRQHQRRQIHNQQE